MKKRIFEEIKKLGGSSSFSGKFPATFFISGTREKPAAEIVEDLLIKFSRHTPFKFEANYRATGF